MEEQPRCPLAVLIVEDSEDDALLTIDALRVGGYEPCWKRVETAAEMELALSQAVWHLIIADHRLPRFSALEAFEIYRRFSLDLPFIIVSGVMGEEIAVAAMKAGVHDYLTKGNLARLAPAVRRELREAESRKERVRAEAALRAAYGELAAIQSSAPVLLVVLDHELRVERANELTAHLAGRNVEDLSGLPWGGAIGCLNALADPRGCGHSSLCGECTVRRAALDTLCSGRPHGNVEAWLPLSVGGQRQNRCLLFSTTAMGSSQAKKALICAQDVTELKLAQVELEQRLDQLNRALAERDILFREVQHRVKNNLQIISSLLSIQAEQCGEASVAAALEDSRDRVRSMASVHERLCYVGTLAHIDFGEYVEELGRELLASHTARAQGIELHTDVHARLGLDEAILCGLIINELVTNSLKHAFPARRGGDIWLELNEVNGELNLHYHDNGVGLPSGFDLTHVKTMGMQIISDLAAQLGGSLECESKGGATFRLRFALQKSATNLTERSNHANPGC